MRDFGVSFGNAPRVHDLRFTFNDEGLERVDGASLALIATHENRLIGPLAWMTADFDPPVLGGLTAGGLISARDLNGLSIAGYHRVHGVQGGLTVALYNDARELHGVQLGLVNHARNNSGVFRVLPLANVHWGS